MIDKIVSYLSQGFTQTQVSSMVETTASYVSQIANTPEYKVIIEAELTRLKTLKHDTEIEEKYTQLEKNVLKQVNESLPFAEFRDLTRAMEILIRRKQQLSSHQQSSFVVNGNAQFNTVVLSIPKAAVPEIVLNSQREVIAIGSKSLAPMAASGVRALFDTIQRKKEQAHLPKQYTTVSTSVPEDF